MSDPTSDETPEYDQSPLERRVAKMDAGEARRVVVATMTQWAQLDEDVRDEVEEVLGDWAERDENGEPDILNIVRRLVGELKDARG